MAYCNQCGAYIPDGHSKCLACGHDETEARQQASAAYEYKYEEAKHSSTDFLKEQLEQQRKRQQENSRKWAEQEKAQREKARQNNQSYSVPRSTDSKKHSAPSSISGSKLFSALSYLSILFILPYIFLKDDDFALFHAKQGLVLFVVGIAAKIAASILGLAWLVDIGKLYFIYKGVVNALEGRKEMLPYIGGLF